MPTAGDTRLGPLAGGFAIAIPADDAIDIAVDLSEITYQLRIEEWIAVPLPMWITGGSQDIVSVANMVLSINPAHTTDTLTFLIDPNTDGNDHIGLITIPSLEDFSGSTEYIWSVNLDITHGTLAFGEVTRNYTTDEASFTVVASTPTKATNPTPTDTDTEVDFSDYTVSWDDGGGADSYNVYFGDSDTPVSLGNQAETSIVVPYTTEIDEEGVTHAYIDGTEINWNVPLYWRIDAVNDAGTTEGDVWSFDPRAAKVTNPTPTDADTDIELYPEYDWDASTVATSYDLYVGIGELMGDIAIDVLGLEATSYDSAVVDFQNGNIWGYNSTYYWRVDSVNEFGTVEGDEWTFDSILFAPPLPSGMSLTDVEGEEGELTGTPSGENAISTVRRLLVAAANKIFYEDE